MHESTFELRTPGRDAMIDVTGQVREAIRESGLTHGQVTVYVPHTTAGVTINENADPDVIHDVLAILDQAIPWRQSFYRHGEGNSAAHVKSSLMGCSAVIPLVNGRMALGTWQSVFFCEFDGPRTRQVIVTVTGE
jgi:secondary thiamine-phosphate synthase enzyme